MLVGVTANITTWSRSLNQWLGNPRFLDISRHFNGKIIELSKVLNFPLGGLSNFPFGNQRWIHEESPALEMIQPETTTNVHDGSAIAMD